jgi:hypothetical protein
MEEGGCLDFLRGEDGCLDFRGGDAIFFALYLSPSVDWEELSIDGCPSKYSVILVLPERVLVVVVITFKRQINRSNSREGM